MRIVSKIKTIFPKECIHDLASVCDTKRIPSNIKKMILVAKVLKANGIQFVILGGATNRLVVQVGDYAIKIAVDQQGYKDNLMEYSICRELQPYVTKSYETNGYILVQQCVRLMTDDEWVNYKGDILRILDSFSHDYLLGDVGYITKNRANWGIDDNGNVVILDYAYCHRATQKLFECEVCGDGILVYDQNYDFLMCNNRESCHARFTYNERKRIQGDQVDLDMIEERKRESIVLPGDQVERDVQTLSGDIIDDNTVVIHSWGEYQKFLEEENMAVVEFDNEKDMKTILDIVRTSATDKEGAMLLHDEWAKGPDRPKKKVVFAEDFVYPKETPIAAKPMDCEYGETEEEYYERKKEEEAQLREEGESDMGETMEIRKPENLVEDTRPAVDDDWDEEPEGEIGYTPAQLIERARKLLGNNHNQNILIDVPDEDPQVDDLGFPIFHRKIEVPDEEEKSAGKVYIE